MWGYGLKATATKTACLIVRHMEMLEKGQLEIIYDYFGV